MPAGITFDNDTLIQVGETGTVYTEQNLKNGIPVEVPANGSIDVVFAGKVDTLASNEYSKTLTNQATVDNEPTNEVTTNVTKANITAHKESEPASGSKVRAEFFTVFNRQGDSKYGKSAFSDRSS